MEIAEVHRKYVDYNRTEECAFEPSSNLARDAYKEYHNRIVQKIEEMLPQNSNDMAFLFDIHGTDRLDVNGDFIEVIIGTDEGHSIQALGASTTTTLNPELKALHIFFNTPCCLGRIVSNGKLFLKS